MALQSRLQSVASKAQETVRGHLVPLIQRQHSPSYRQPVAPRAIPSVRALAVASHTVVEQLPLTSTSTGLQSFNLEWSFPLLNAHECAAQMQASQQVIVLDVRNRDEFEAGHLVTAQHLPVADVESGGAALDEFLYDHGLEASHIIVHCMFSAKRGPRGAKALQKKLKNIRAFKNQVYLLTGGIAEFMVHYGQDRSLVWLPDPTSGWKPVPH